MLMFTFLYILFIVNNQQLFFECLKPFIEVSIYGDELTNGWICEKFYFYNYTELFTLVFFKLILLCAWEHPVLVVT